MENNVRKHHTTLKFGISRSKEFEKKGLASYVVNPGIKCGHDCKYCSTGAVLRMHHGFKDCGENPFGHGYCIIDPSTPKRVKIDAKRIRKRGMIQLCSTVDAYAPEAQEHQMGRKCLKAILSEPEWTVRILTKNAAVRYDFDLIEKHQDRVLIGLSITATPDKRNIIELVEPNASSIKERMSVMMEAAARGFRTYAMFCPLIAGIADEYDQIDKLIKFASDCRVEEIFAEPVNPRGPGLKHCQEALEQGGYNKEAKAIERIRHKKQWSCYVADLVANVQQSVRKHSDITKLRFLLYPSQLTEEDKKRILKDDAGVVWL